MTEPLLKKSKLTTALNRLLFEDMSYGIYDRPGPDEKMDPEFKPTVPNSVPLKPTELMSTQLTSERPPIEDENYRPTSIPDLKNAAGAIAELVPTDQVEKFYMQLQRLLDDTVETQRDQETPRSAQVAAEQEEKEEKIIKKESHVRKNRLLSMSLENLLNEIRRSDKKSTPVARVSPSNMTLEALLREVQGPAVTKVPRFRAPKSTLTTSQIAAIDDIGSGDLESPALPDDDAILSQMASEFGYSGPPGMRQEINRLLALLRQLLEAYDIKEIENLMEECVPEFAEISFDLGIINREDADALKENPTYTREEFYAFRNFFNSLIRPEYDALKKLSEKNVRVKMTDLGIPRSVQDTVFNQISGGADKKESTLVKRLSADATQTPETINNTIKIINNNFSLLQDIFTQMPDTLLDKTLDKLRNMSEEQKDNAVLAAYKRTKTERDKRSPAPTTPAGETPVG